MFNNAQPSRNQLLELLQRQDGELQNKANELQNKDNELQNKDNELQNKDNELQNKDSELQNRDIKLVQLGDVIAQQELIIKDWELAYSKLLRQQFEARSERYIANPDQLALDFGDTDEAADAATGLSDALEEADLIPAHKRRKPRKKRDESLPAHLPRYFVTAEVPESEKNCDTHGPRELLPESMWDITERLEFLRPLLRVRATKHPKWVCPAGCSCGVGSAERPTGIIEGDKYDTTIAAEIITNKFGFHLPVYRQQDLFAGSGWTPGRSTLLNILVGAAFVIEPLLAYFKQTLQTDSVIGCDDTGVTLLYPKQIPKFDLNDPKQRRAYEVYSRAAKNDKPSISAKMWAYRGENVKLNVFDFTVSRHRDGPELFFADYRGVLLGDCWHGFETIATASEGTILRAACNAHARRKIYDSVAYPVERQIWLAWFQQLYDIEDRGRLMLDDQRLELRQSEGQPIWDEMTLWLEEVRHRTTNVILPKSDFGKALNYIRNHQVELQRHLGDAAIPIDNNETEQLMKQIAIGRKNWLFAGSLAGGERSAGFFTLVSSALRNDLDVWQYVNDVLRQMLDGVTDYQPLLPENWAAAHPESIREYRVIERRYRAEQKSEKRADRRASATG